MYRTRNRSGMGTAPPGVYDCSGPISWYLSSSCWSQPAAAWAAQYSAQMSPIAPPPAPTGSVLTVPPASGSDAQATVDTLINQQMTNQQALNATGVSSSWLDTVLGAPAAAANAVAPAVPWVTIGLIGIGVIVLASMAGGRRR